MAAAQLVVTIHLIEQKYHQLKATLATSANDEIIFGINPTMQEIRQRILQVARTPATVLITGETGTGKEMMAMCIQRFSHLKDEPFVKINCTAFSPSLLESELFGYKKGAFTGAMKDKIGLLEKGDGGTIFLDEIGDISLDMQVKLLRFLQFGEVRPVGATETKIIRSRIIAATNRNLEQLIETGKFRADLFYRINSFILELPALRDRKEDIPCLVNHFLDLLCSQYGLPSKRVSDYVMETFENYSWPGNIEELKVTTQRLINFYPYLRFLDDLPQKEFPIIGEFPRQNGVIEDIIIQDDHEIDLVEVREGIIKNYCLAHGITREEYETLYKDQASPIATDKIAS